MARLSEQLAHLSSHVKAADDAADTAEAETHEELAAKVEQARASRAANARRAGSRQRRLINRHGDDSAHRPAGARR